MKIKKITFRNVGSYGNKTHVIEIPDDPSFFLVQGKNGYGKCLDPNTEIDVSIEDEKERKKFEKFLKRRKR